MNEVIDLFLLRTKLRDLPSAVPLRASSSTVQGDAERHHDRFAVTKTARRILARRRRFSILDPRFPKRCR